MLLAWILAILGDFGVSNRPGFPSLAGEAEFRRCSMCHDQLNRISEIRSRGSDEQHDVPVTDNLEASLANFR